MTSWFHLVRQEVELSSSALDQVVRVRIEGLQYAQLTDRRPGTSSCISIRTDCCSARWRCTADRTSPRIAICEKGYRIDFGKDTVSIDIDYLHDPSSEPLPITI